MNESHPTGRLWIYWVLPVAVLIYGMTGNPNTPAFVWWSLFALMACGLPIVVSGHDPLSLVSIVALLHAVYYPISILPNVMASSPGVIEQDLWDATPQAMIACAVGMTAFAIGALLAKNWWRTSSGKGAGFDTREILAVSPHKVLALCLLVVPLTIFKLATGTYFHYLAAGDLGWSEKYTLQYGYVFYIDYVVCAGMFLQLRRYLVSGTRRDLITMIACSLVPFLIMLPSGSRGNILNIVVPVLFLGVVGFSQKVSIRHVFFFAFLGGAVFVTLSAVETYRGIMYYDRGVATFRERMDIIFTGVSEGVPGDDEKYDASINLIGRRFADYVAVGRIIDSFPEIFDFRRLDDIENWPIYLLPNPIRPETPGFDSRDSAILAAKVGFQGGTLSGEGEASSPSMVLGDLYSRFSWWGIAGGMAFLGFLFGCLDHWLRRFGLLETLVFGLLLIPIQRLPQGSFFDHFMFFTRALVIVVVIGLVLRWWLSKEGWGLRRVRIGAFEPRVLRT